MAKHKKYEFPSGHRVHSRESPKVPRCRCSKQCLAKFLRTNVLSFALILGVLAGCIVGVVLQTENVRLTAVQLAYLRFPGDMFLQMMRMVLIPLIVSSLLTATADIDVRSSGRIGIRAILYYLITLVLAALMGVLLVLTIQPGKVATEGSDIEITSTAKGGSPLYAFMDLIRNLIPDNLIEACFLAKATSEVTVDVLGNLPVDADEATAFNFTDQFVTGRHNMTERRLAVKEVAGVNMIGLVAVSMTIGVIVSYLGPAVKPVYDFFLAIRLIMFHLAGIFMWYVPVGIAFLIASTFASLPNLGESLHNLLVFCITVITGLVLHGFVVLSLLYLVVVRKNPLPFIKNQMPAMLFAFGSESSGITIPVTIRCLEERNGVDSRVARLMASIGATINMDGTCLYFSMMTIFIAQLNGISFNVGQIVTSCLLAISVSIGIGCVPGSQLIYITIVPASLHLPTHQVGMLFAVDWLLARCRTVVNVLGDSFGAGIVASLSVKELGIVRTSTDNENTGRGKLLDREPDKFEDS